MVDSSSSFYPFSTTGYLSTEEPQKKSTVPVPHEGDQHCLDALFAEAMAAQIKAQEEADAQGALPTEEFIKFLREQKAPPPAATPILKSPPTLRLAEMVKGLNISPISPAFCRNPAFEPRGIDEKIEHLQTRACNSFSQYFTSSQQRAISAGDRLRKELAKESNFEKKCILITKAMHSAPLLAKPHYYYLLAECQLNAGKPELALHSLTCSNDCMPTMQTSFLKAHIIFQLHPTKYAVTYCTYMELRHLYRENPAFVKQCSQAIDDLLKQLNAYAATNPTQLTSIESCIVAAHTQNEEVRLFHRNQAIEKICLASDFPQVYSTCLMQFSEVIENGLTSQNAEANFATAILQSKIRNALIKENAAHSKILSYTINTVDHFRLAANLNYDKAVEPLSLYDSIYRKMMGLDSEAEHNDIANDPNKAASAKKSNIA